ncbi:hypothetical protein ACWDSJ_22630 [Nocardia sp. NPDC003482]
MTTVTNVRRRTFDIAVQVLIAVVCLAATVVFSVLLLHQRSAAHDHPTPQPSAPAIVAH